MRGRAQKLIASLERDPGSIPAIASFKKEKFISSKWHVERRLRRFFIRRDKVKLSQFSSVPTVSRVKGGYAQSSLMAYSSHKKLG